MVITVKVNCTLFQFYNAIKSCSFQSIRLAREYKDLDMDDLTVML